MSTTEQEEQRPRLDRWVERKLGDDQHGRLGSGWWSGVLSVLLGVCACGAVVVLYFPGAFSMEDLRARYPMGWMRALIEVVIGVGFLAGCVSVVLRRRKVLGALGIGLSLLALAAGGGKVPIDGVPEGSVYLGLDWFLLSIFVTALLFVPLERLWPQWPEQGSFRVGWTTDVLHFWASHVGVQAMTFFVLLPGTLLQGIVVGPAWIGAQPLALQFVELVVLGDLTQYAVHRAFHRVPLLWRFHAIHHSSRAIDWLAGSRLHLVDALLTRALVATPIALLGFAEPAFYAWLVSLTAHAVFVHANLSARFGWLERLLVTPRYHHWHHSAEEQALDTNFAVQLPIIDRLFGTQYFPRERWPEQYGIEGDPVPEDFLAQLAYPLRGAQSKSIDSARMR